MAEQSKVLGIGELSANFKQLGRDMEQRGSRAMVAAGGGVLRTEARRLALGYGFRKSGALLKNIVMKRERTPAGLTQYNLGVRHGRNLTKKQKSAGRKLARDRGRIVTRYKDDPFYWWFLEGGWKTARGGRQVPGRSFIARSLENKASAAIEAMNARLLVELAKAQRK